MSTQTKHYKQLTLGQRYQLQAMQKNGLSLQAIADTLGVDKSTVSRELKRNSGPDGYCPETAENKKTDRKRNARKAKKRDEQHKQIVAKGLSLGWSPENISCRMKIELPDKAISHTTIYHLIAQDKVNGGTLYQELPRFGKTRWKDGKRKAGRTLIPDRKDITERPAIVEQRALSGDWEGDTVYGQDAHLVTLVDRKSRLTLIGKVDSKNADTIANKMIEMLKRVHGAKTVTLDNGGEFAMHARVSKAINADIYFAKPYASYQRGTNENTNGIIRRHWPKKMAFGQLTVKEVEVMELQINSMPRKVLGGLTPIEVYTGRSVALIA
ncbi:IS30 family transposase [Kistimonas asteriae]|uniref:IS30 family transposase n=1 Tax=Kistimonas asteriae TaxID=517724 RepID=UPI001BA83B34|nr:IS30 family transposase [Kistimonas asteriae]